MKKCWSSLLLLVLLGCKEQKVDLSGETPLKINDLLTVFPKLSLPLSVSDTNVVKLGDTVTIGYKAFVQFFPDSAILAITGPAKRMVIHPVGRIEKDKENYLLASFTTSKNTSYFAVFVTDKKNHFLAAKALLSSASTDGYTHSVTINREPTFLLSREKMGKENQVQFSRAGWVYTSEGYFMIVIHDSNEDISKNTIINPVDSLPRKNKFSGDYAQDKKNFISIRDGKTPNSYLFFIHFEKNEGSCTGELKGEMKMKADNNAQFTQNGDPCVIDFSFGDREITLKEQGSCGTHRGIKCFFNDTFTKRKESRQARKKA